MDEEEGVCTYKKNSSSKMGLRSSYMILVLTCFSLNEILQYGSLFPIV